MDSKAELVAAYKRYGFTLAQDNASAGVIVFTLKTGYFDNAEIVKLSLDAKTDEVFKEFSLAGYACTVRESLTSSLAEEELFDGFFSVESTRSRLLEDYGRFASNLVKPYGEDAVYEYIKAPYQIDGKEGQKTPPQEILDRINDEKPVLFLIEAAAGYGKTCTAQEIVKLLTEQSAKLPLYAELSRNRQARIFRYILLDEIDRTFPLLSSGLVQSEIKNGRITAILDGFDELLRKGEDAQDFENREPMLETVSELLTGKAKIVITTRRTVLFDGDGFHQWLDRHSDAFSVVRIRIQEPKVADWLNHERVEALQRAGLDLDAMANPVLLSYLRCISQQRFSDNLAIPESIVQSYFEYMLDRERERQDLRMTVNEQSLILSSIAKDMINHGYTAEHRDYLVKFLLEFQSDALEQARNQYFAADRPSREEISNKLASHALLDRSVNESGKIGFVNEFCLGNYVAENVIWDSEWLSDDLRFIDPAVRSYAPRTETSRAQLFTGLVASIPYLEIGSQVEIFAKLKNELPNDLTEGAVDGLELVGLEVGKSKIFAFQFSDVVFRKCKFVRDNLNEVTFLNCRFFDCEVAGEIPGGNIHVLGGVSSPDISASLGSLQPKTVECNLSPGRDLLLQKSVLRRFWPVGDSTSQRPSRPVYKPMKFLCQPIDDYSLVEIYRCVEGLQRRGILVEMNRSNLMTLNLENVAEASAILGATE